MARGETYHHAERIVSIVSRSNAPVLERPELSIAQSWERCLSQYKLSPEMPGMPNILEQQSLRERQERLGPLLGIAKKESQRLFRQTAGSGYAVLLTDPDGIIVNYVGDPTLDDAFKQAGLRPGANWSEHHEGTNGIGTAIAERRLVTVHRDEHFRTQHIGLTCSGTPIIDEHGRVAAVLDTSFVGSRDSRRTQTHAGVLVSLSAMFIANCDFLRHNANAWVLHLHDHPESLCLLNDPMLAIDADGLVVGASYSALTRLGYTSCGELVGRPVTEVLQIDLAVSLKTSGPHQPYVTQRVQEMGRKEQFFVTVRPPKRTTRSLTVSQGKHLRAVEGKKGQANCMTLLGLAGQDPRMAYNVRLAERVMNKDVSILLLGETGTGKDAFAQAIHRASQRTDKPFVPVNCASIPESLIESELFGYRHGAFTGARREGMRGKILQASGGTLLLDEIGDMPPYLQTRLLRVLEEREVYPLGSDAPIAVDLHVICATHRDLQALVRDGRFREDLYYRINGITLSIPSLRDRCDKEALIGCALAAENDSGEEISIEENAVLRLLSYPWPGNIRELRNVLRTALALCDEGVIRLSDLPAEVVYYTERESIGDLPTLKADPVAEPNSEETNNPLDLAEREAIIKELERNHWNVTNTAIRLHMSRNTLYRRMKRHGIGPSGPS